MARTTYKPKPSTRRIVRYMILAGADKEIVRQCIIDPSTGEPLVSHIFDKAFEHEIKYAVAEVNGQVVDAMLAMARGRRARYDKSGRLIQSEVKPQFPAAKFWLTTKAGFTEEGAQLTVDEFARQVAQLGKIMRDNS